MGPRKTNKLTTGKGTCFIITPYGGWFDDYYETIYRPAIEAGGLVATRADDLYRPGTIVNDIWKFAQDARIVLADLTHKNPNVFYELGLAHALAKPAILITEAIEDIPFDLRSLRVLQYDKNRPRWGEDLKSDITRAIREVLKSPAEAVLPTFLRVKPEPKGAILTEEAKAVLQLRQEIDALRREFVSTRHMGIHDRIRPEEAESLLEHYLRCEYPTRAILRRLAARGVPEAWTESMIKKKLGQVEQPQLPFEKDKPSNK